MKFITISALIVTLLVMLGSTQPYQPATGFYSRAKRQAFIGAHAYKCSSGTFKYVNLCITCEKYFQMTESRDCPPTN